MSSIYDVSALHKKFGFPVLEKPGFLDEQFMKMRIAFIQEELDELKKAYTEKDLESALDALIDITYVTLGTADLMGLRNPVPPTSKKAFEQSIWWAAWARVHEANMKKEKGMTTRGFNIDLKKPKGWLKPQFKDLLV